ncbi:MAG TPA: NTP transferase domain-containing protein [Negativicutes bacterium]|nr:NTP transferase domain-containing protein [Negativicutes bacterium]
MKTGAVIVAAGMSSRMGDFKPMLKIGTISMVQRIISTFQQAGVFPIILVTGYRSAELEKHVARMGVICVRNEDFANSQMIDSAKIGFSYIMSKCDRTFFTPVDIPLFTVNTVMRLMESKAQVVKPICSNADGHPILLSCDILTTLTAAGCDKGLKCAIDECCDNIETIEVGDEGVLHDADTPEDYKRLIERHNRQLLRPAVEISLMRENKLFDKAGAFLLHMVAYTGTVKGACEKMQISYSKAWSMLSTLEENLGFALIDRRPGGEFGGGSQLTPEGRDLLDRYERFSEKIRQFADEYFTECFKGGTPAK